MTYVIHAPKQADLGIAGRDERFPLRRIYCVGRNYAAHAIEMGKDPTREAPFFFSKPADTVLDTPASVPYPPQTSDLHYEIELVVALGKGGRDIAPEDVMDLVWGASVGVDLTRRDLQAEAKNKGRPWDLAKGFDQSAPCAPLVPLDRIASLETGRIWLAVNGALRQEADLADMIWSLRDLVSILSETVKLEPGDLIMTGTPAGVGAVVRGDVISGGVDGLAELEVEIV